MKNLKKQIQEQPHGKVWDRVHWYPPHDKTYNNVYNQIWDQVWSQVYEQVREQVLVLCLDMIDEKS